MPGPIEARGIANAPSGLFQRLENAADRAETHASRLMTVLARLRGHAPTAQPETIKERTEGTANDHMAHLERALELISIAADELERQL